MKNNYNIKNGNLIKFDYIIENLEGERFIGEESIETIVGNEMFLFEGFWEVLVSTNSKNGIVSIKGVMDEMSKIFPNQEVKVTISILKNEANPSSLDENENSEFKSDNQKKDFKKRDKKENEKLREQIENLKSELNVLSESFKYKVLEIENKSKEKLNEIKNIEFEKTKNEVNNAKKYANQKFIESIIDPLSLLEMTINSNTNQDPAISAYLKGFEMLINQVFTTLFNFGVTEIKPSIGEKYNPELHEIFDLKYDDRLNDQEIISIVKKGFKLSDRVIKPASVVICKKN